MCIDALKYALNDHGTPLEVSAREWEDWEATQAQIRKKREESERLAGLLDDWDLLPDAEPTQFRPWDQASRKSRCMP